MTILKSILLLAVVCLLTPVHPLQADMYSWTDENGVKHFSNTPPTKDQTVGKIEAEAEVVGPSRSSETVDQTDGAQPSEKKEALKKPAPKKKVVMFVTANCGWCKRAKAYFQKSNVQYIAYDIQKSKDAYRKFKALGGRGVPLILIGDQKIVGFNKQAINEAMGLN